MLPRDADTVKNLCTNIFYAFLIAATPTQAADTVSTSTEQETKTAEDAEDTEDTDKCEDEDDPLTLEVNRLKSEKAKLDLEISLQSTHFEKTLTQIQQESRKLELENQLKTARSASFKSDLEMQKARLELENAIATEKQTQTLAEYEIRRKKLEVENAILAEKNKAVELEIQLETAKLGLETAKLELERTKRNLNTEILTEKIAEREIKRQWESQADKPIEYLTEPYVNGHLNISDRRISLNDIILSGTAEYVTERLHYFNNKSAEFPVFIVIDDSPGGSVMETMRIIEAMHSSQAPVYVVVKSFAASAAAMITTLAERSYAYPNAVILHHQVMDGAYGNPVHHKEHLQILQEWAKRTTQPVAEKMGLTLEEFVQQMYENNSDGDWHEFADRAAKLKWVDHVVKDVRESSFIDQPNELEESVELETVEQVDEQGRAYVKLPMPNPLDAYHIYNPNNYYRW